MASIVKRGNTYAIAVCGKDDNGKKKYHWISGFKTMKEAKQRQHEIESQKDGGIYVAPGKITFAEYLERWLKDYVWPNLSPRTAEGYENMISVHIAPAIGKILLTEIKPSVIQKYYSDKLATGRADGNGGLNPCTIKHHHTALHGAFQLAVKQGLIIRNPCDAVTPPHFQKTEMNILDESGIYTVLEAAKETEYYALFYLALYTGMRRSELLGLKWSDIDLIGCELSVNRSLHHLRSGETVFRQPKTARSRRRIALSPSTALVLKQHKENQIAERLLTGKPLSDDEMVFCHPDGMPLLPESVTHAWIKLTRRLGMNIRLHDARHTHASLMLKEGVHPAIVQQRLGHASITTTIDTYSHILPGLQAAAAKGFDELVNRKNLENEKVITSSD
jgi:integrase